MRRTLIITIPTAGIIALALTAAPAAATDCVPVEARDAIPATYETVTNPDYTPEQTIEHEAVGEPTIEVVDTEAWVEKIEHPAVYEYIEHPAVYEDRVVKVEYRKKAGKSGWKYNWFPVEAKPDPNSGWKPTGNVKTETVKVKDAWTEKVKVSEGWVETIEHPATYTTVPNPDHVPAWTETIPATGEPTIEVLVDPGSPAVEAVECETVVIELPDPEQAGEQPTATDDPPVTDEPMLAETGTDTALAGLAAAGLIGAGTLARIAVRGRTES